VPPGDGPIPKTTVMARLAVKRKTLTEANRMILIQKKPQTPFKVKTRQPAVRR